MLQSVPYPLITCSVLSFLRSPLLLILNIHTLKTVAEISASPLVAEGDTSGFLCAVAACSASALLEAICSWEAHAESNSAASIGGTRALGDNRAITRRLPGPETSGRTPRRVADWSTFASNASPAATRGAHSRLMVPALRSVFMVHSCPEAADVDSAPCRAESGGQERDGDSFRHSLILPWRSGVGPNAPSGGRDCRVYAQEHPVALYAREAQSGKSLVRRVARKFLKRLCHVGNRWLSVAASDTCRRVACDCIADLF